MQAIGIASTSTSLIHLPTTHYHWSSRRREGPLRFVASPLLHGRYSSSLHASRRRTLVAMCQQQQPHPPEDDEDDDGSEENGASPLRNSLVDENMLTLRRRIGELREVVGGVGGADHDDRAVKDWSKKATKKHKVTLYHTDMLDVLALMQLDLQRKRADVEEDEEEAGERDPQHKPPPLPAKIGFGLTLMVTVTVPVSMILVALHLIDAAKVIVDGIHTVKSLQK